MNGLGKELKPGGMGAQQGKMPGQPPVGYQGSSMPPPPPPLPSATRNEGPGSGGGNQPPRQVSKIKGLKPRQGQHQPAPRSPLASQSSPGAVVTGQAIPASPLATNIFSEHNGKTWHISVTCLIRIYQFSKRGTN